MHNHPNGQRVRPSTLRCAGRAAVALRVLLEDYIYLGPHPVFGRGVQKNIAQQKYQKCSARGAAELFVSCCVKHLRLPWYFACTPDTSVHSFVSF